MSVRDNPLNFGAPKKFGCFLKWLWRQLEMGALMTDPEAYAAVHDEERDDGCNDPKQR